MKHTGRILTLFFTIALTAGLLTACANPGRPTDTASAGGTGPAPGSEEVTSGETTTTDKGERIMKIEKVGGVKVIQAIDPVLLDQDNYFGYFGWPSAARLQDGRIAVVSSGFRNNHTCPFGKVVISYSDDEGQTFTPPAVIFDTPLDDRDPGIVPFGEKGVLITTFNAPIASLLRRAQGDDIWTTYVKQGIPADADEKYFGSLFIVSEDGGKSFGPTRFAPVTTPHGPIPLQDGTMLWTGNHHGKNVESDDFRIFFYKMTPDGTFTQLASVGPIYDDKGGKININEPYTAQMPDGTLICHIRAEKGNEMEMFTTYQTESKDGGLTWSEPHPILPTLGGATSHLFVHSSGVLISCVEQRQPPFRIRVMLSEDYGATWSTDHFIFSRGLYENYRVYPDMDYPANDLGYPTTVELKDGSLLTVFYCRFPALYDKAVILGQQWRIVNK